MEEPNPKTGHTESVAAVEDFKRECERLQESLPRARSMGLNLVQHEGYWHTLQGLPWILSFKRNFKALDADIFVATKPKCGTTWLKALVFSIVYRHLYPDMEDHPLSKANPHELVPFAEYYICNQNNRSCDSTSIASPRLFGIHCAFEVMPESMKNSNCRIIYMCRNPLDAFASSWHFLPAIGRLAGGADLEDEQRSLEVNFDKFCQGVEFGGPFLDHVLGYWEASKRRPDKVLFLLYEDVKQHPDIFVKRIAEFLGCPFSPEEERCGKIEEITGLCSFERLSQMDINKHGTHNARIVEVENKLFFRKGEVGDWVNLLSPSMAKRYEEIAKHRLEGSGLSFKFTIL